MRIAIVTFAALFISGCGLNYGEEKAVSKLSIGEIIVSQTISRTATREDIDRKISAFGAAVPFDVHKTLGNGCESVSIVGTKAKQIAPDANAITASFSVGKDYFIDMEFIGRAMNVKIGYLYDSPLYLIGLSVRHKEDVLSSYNEISGAAIKIVSAMTIECRNLEGLLNVLNNQFEESKNEKLKKMREKIVGDFFGEFETDPMKPEEQRKKEFDDIIKIIDEWAPNSNLNEEQNREEFFKFLAEKQKAN